MFEIGSLGWPETRYVDEAGFELIKVHLPLPLGLKDLCHMAHLSVGPVGLGLWQSSMARREYVADNIAYPRPRNKEKMRKGLSSTSSSGALPRVLKPPHWIHL